MKNKLLLVFTTILFLSSCSKDDDNNSNCFSPTQNQTNAYDEDFVGCDCDSVNDIDICVQDDNGRNVALICSENKWIAVEDGPCTQIPNDTNNNLSNQVNIRLSNTSNLKFENATFNNVNFGDIEPGQITEYKIFESSYSYGSVSITINGQDYGWEPFDFVGENLLESDDYTFKYSFNSDDNLLTDELVKD